MAFLRELREDQLIPLFSSPSPLFFTIHNYLSLARYFQESNGTFMCLSMGIAYVSHCKVHTCGPAVTLRVSVIYLFLMGFRGVKSQASGHCLKSNTEGENQRLGLTHTPPPPLYSETFEEMPLQALLSQVLDLYDLWRLQSDVCWFICTGFLLNPL